VKSGLLASGALIWAAPLFAQSAPDPLAPLPVASSPTQSTPAAPAPPAAARDRPAIQPAPAPAIQPSAASPSAVTAQTAPPLVRIPRDWRGVFDAIDAGSWASAQAGIAVLPRSILTPVARAELYTARGSPVVDLGSLQALIAEAPELPQAD